MFIVIIWPALLKSELLWHLSNVFQTNIRDHVGWSLTGNRKQKNMSNFLPEEWSRSLKKLEQWTLTRETREFSNSIWLRNKTVIYKVVVAYEEWSLWERWLYMQTFRRLQKKLKNYIKRGITKESFLAGYHLAYQSEKSYIEKISQSFNQSINYVNLTNLEAN